MKKHEPMPKNERESKKAQDLLQQYQNGNDKPEFYALGDILTGVEPLGNGCARAIMRENTFDILVGFPEPTKEEVESFSKNIVISLFTYNYVPFIILHTDKFTVDMSINIQKLKPEYIDDWLESDNNFVRIFFVVSNNMKLVAMRYVELPLMRHIRENLNQEVNYSKSEIESFIDMAMVLYDTMQMYSMSEYKNTFD